MDARTAFDREPGRSRHAAASGRVPLKERPWFRVAGLVVIMGWVGVCVYFSMRLAT
jgi:hypothetical protein